MAGDEDKTAGGAPPEVASKGGITERWSILVEPYARSVPCPRCGARAGEPCRNRLFPEMPPPPGGCVARIEAWERAGGAEFSRRLYREAERGKEK